MISNNNVDQFPVQGTHHYLNIYNDIISLGEYFMIHYLPQPSHISQKSWWWMELGLTNKKF